MNTISKNIKPFYVYTDRNCLYIKNINENTEKLANNMFTYSANFDDSNKIHICGIDTSGKLLHFVNSNGVWKKKIVHRFFNNVKNIKDMRLYIFNNLINIFIIESYPLSDNLYKVSHINFDISDYKASRYNINNIFKDKECIYKLNLDELSNIVFEYKSKNNISRNVSNNVIIFNNLSRKWINHNSLMRSSSNSTTGSTQATNIKDDIFEYCYSIKYKL